MAEVAKLRDHVLGQVGRDREADADRAAGRRVDGGVDADDLAVHVEQRAAGVAPVDGGVGLDEVVVRSLVDVAAAGATMPAVTEPPRPNGLPIASTQSPTRDLSLSPNCTAGSGLSAVTFSTAMSARVVLAEQRGLQRGVVLQDHGDLVRAVDHVVVGDDDAGRVDDEARAEALRRGRGWRSFWLRPPPPWPPRRLRSMKSLKNCSNGEPGGNTGTSGPRLARPGARRERWVEEMLTTPGSSLAARSAKPVRAPGTRAGPERRTIGKAGAASMAASARSGKSVVGACRLIPGELRKCARTANASTDHVKSGSSVLMDRDAAGRRGGMQPPRSVPAQAASGSPNPASAPNERRRWRRRPGRPAACARCRRTAGRAGTRWR